MFFCVQRFPQLLFPTNETLSHPPCTPSLWPERERERERVKESSWENYSWYSRPGHYRWALGWKKSNSVCVQQSEQTSKQLHTVIVKRIETRWNLGTLLSFRRWWSPPKNKKRRPRSSLILIFLIESEDEDALFFCFSGGMTNQGKSTRVLGFCFFAPIFFGRFPLWGPECAISTLNGFLRWFASEMHFLQPPSLVSPGPPTCFANLLDF